MDFDREYMRVRQPADPDDFTDSNVQALVEGRRKKALPRPRLDLEPPPYDDQKRRTNALFRAHSIPVRDGGH